MMSSGLNRRDLFSMLARPFQRPVEKPEAAPAEPQVAVIQGRHCIAITSFCSSCVERCPVPGALYAMDGMPMVDQELCTGCGICHDVCPAPVKAVLMLPRRPKPGADSR